MRLDPRSNKDFLAGLLFALIGGFAMVGAFAYPIGSAMRMGAGYFPALLGAVLVLFGLVPALAAMLVTAALAGREFRWRETLVLAVTMSAFAVALFVYGLQIPFRLFVGW